MSCTARRTPAPGGTSHRAVSAAAHPVGQGDRPRVQEDLAGRHAAGGVIAVPRRAPAPRESAPPRPRAASTGAAGPAGTPGSTGTCRKRRPGVRSASAACSLQPDPPRPPPPDSPRPAAMAQKSTPADTVAWPPVDSCRPLSMSTCTRLGGRSARDGGQRAEAHQGGAVAVDGDDAPVGTRDGEAQRQAHGAAHGAHHVELVRRVAERIELAPGEAGGGDEQVPVAGGGADRRKDRVALRHRRPCAARARSPAGGSRSGRRRQRRFRHAALAHDQREGPPLGIACARRPGPAPARCPRRSPGTAPRECPSVRAGRGVIGAHQFVLGLVRRARRARPATSR